MDRKILIAVCSAIVVVAILLVMRVMEGDPITEPPQAPGAAGQVFPDSASIAVTAGSSFALPEEDDPSFFRDERSGGWSADPPTRVKGAKWLSPTGRLIALAPTRELERFSPVALVQAVNHLRSLGKERAIAELEEYVDVVFDPHVEVDRVPPYPALTRNCQNVFLIVRLLFEFDHDEEGFPYHHTTLHSPEGACVSAFPRFPLAVHGDLPYLLIGVHTHGAFLSPPGKAWALLDYCFRFGKLRETDLVPVDDPASTLDELEAIIESTPEPHPIPEDPPWAKMLFHGTFYRAKIALAETRKQCWRTYLDATTGAEPSDRDSDDGMPETEEQWQESLERAKRVRLTWDQATWTYLVNSVGGDR